ncbi:hypothetical protein FSP39_004757 [Pinctada imbricata]|uniref:Uncharacterized protein n=1 Tax=Pinctada imbricata TaxID=66713 RepID=A0AA88Y841_PINIB|nr:hypothetical protein FSP39_004757 [Pinctada imbricata]
MMVGSILIYYFRIFERKYGSQKFMGHLLGTYIFSTMLEMALIYTLSRLEVRLDHFPSGPVELGRVMGIPMTGKSFQYFIGLQLATGSLESILVAMCGIVAGILWRHNFLKIQKLIFIPDFLGSLCHTIIGQFVESTEPSNPALPMGATLELQRQEQLDRLEQQVIWQSLRQQQMPMGQQAQVSNCINFILQLIEIL